MKFLLSAAFIFCAALLSGNGLEKNLYTNPDYKSVTLKNGRFVIRSHWYSGKTAPGGKYKNHPAVKLTPIKTPWGYMGSISNNTVKLAPGRYCMMVWCKYDKKDVKSINTFHITYRRTANGKVHNDARRYRDDLPAAGKWVELAFAFTVKPGDTRINLLYGHAGPKCADALYAAPRLVKLEE